MILNLWDSIEKVANNFKDFISDHSGPVLMIVLFLIGLAVFSITWNALHKGE